MNATQELKQLRADADVLLVMANELRDSRETNTAYTKLQEAKMHIGNTLHELGTAPIYKNSKDPSNKAIEPYHIDYDITPMAIPADWNQNGKIENTKIMRRELDKILAGLREVNFFQTETLVLGRGFIDTRKQLYAGAFLHEAQIRVRESQNFYGLELGRIRDTQYHTVPSES